MLLSGKTSHFWHNTGAVSHINYTAGYISDNNKHRLSSKVNNDKTWHEWISLVMLGTCMVYPLCSWMTTYRNVTSTHVTHVLEFTEEYLTVFWTNVHALLCVYFWLPDTLAKMTRSRWSYNTNVYIFKVTFNQESWQYVPYSVCKLIRHSLLKGFSVI